MADYIEVFVDAIDAIRDISKQNSVYVIGACAGGITCATTMGYLAGLKQMDKVSSLTLMVNVLEPMYNDSVAGLFATDGAIEMARKRSAKVGVLDGSEMARVFNWMRPNDLIWKYVVNNYLNGLPPPAYDILFWISDTTRLPARLHSDFLDVFLDSPFSNSGKMKIRDVEIDIGKVECPVLITGGTTDHITRWQACYRSTQLFGGKANYVLSTAGHIQSLINPPEAVGSKRKYFISDSCPPNAEEWFEQAEENQGSWWPYWSKWLSKHSGKTINAPKTLGNKTYKPLIESPAMAPPSMSGYLYQLFAAAGWTSLFWLHKLKQKTLIMAGDDDPIIRPINAKILTSRIPNATLKTFNCGHLFILTRLKESVELITEILADIYVDTPSKNTKQTIKTNTLLKATR